MNGLETFSAAATPSRYRRHGNWARNVFGDDNIVTILAGNGNTARNFFGSDNLLKVLGGFGNSRETCSATATPSGHWLVIQARPPISWGTATRHVGRRVLNGARNFVGEQ